MNNDFITLIAVGDISPGDHYFTLGHGVRAVFEKKGGGYLFAKVQHLFQKGDIGFCNLEGVLSDDELKRESPASYGFRGNPFMAKTLREAGIDIANIANNHILQHGQKSFDETIAHLNKNKISPLGIREQGAYSSLPLIKECKGLTLGFLGYSFVPEQFYPQNVPYAISSLEAIKSDIKCLQQHVDIVVLSGHFGLEISNNPSLNSIDLMHALIDAGADIIIRHHPHDVQPVEFYKEKLILYSLGDFIFDLFWGKELLLGAIAEIKIRHDREITVKMHPVLINEYCQPVPINDKAICTKLNTFIHTGTYREISKIENENYGYYIKLHRKNIILNLNKIFYFFSRLPFGRTRLKLKFFLKKIISRMSRLLS
ncbi:MAG: CapA family protein [Parachlamydiaceae bacterium]|nr:CapA family protein [Parachlamydiaceae bacterium]